MTEPQPDFGKLQYRGPGVANPAHTLWLDPTTGEDVELHPTTVMRWNLTDRMREAVEAQNTDPVPEGSLVAPEISLATFDEGELDGPFTPVGGYDSEWRWDYVHADGEILVAMDNRPAIDAAVEAGTPAPRLEQAVIPLELLRVVARAT